MGDVKTKLTNSTTVGTDSTVMLSSITETTNVNCYASYSYSPTASALSVTITGTSTISAETDKATMQVKKGL